MIIGITGGSGTGKTTVSNILRGFGIEIVDGDRVSRLITAPGEAALSEITEEFGAEVLLTDGSLNRRWLGEIVFSDKEKLKKLNSITHKYIKQYFLERVADKKSEIIGFDGAALFESGMDKLCDFVIGIIADEDVRIQRIVKRDGISAENAKKRLLSQKNNEFYIENCDFLVYNNSNEENLKKQLTEVTEKLKKEEERKKADFQK